MTYAEAWNKIVGYYEKYGTDLEEKIQTVWEDSVFSAILNYNTTEIDAQRAVQMGSTKKADIVVREDGKDVVVVELKRHTESVLGKGQDQLFSYLNQLKSVDIGILVCNKLYVYDFDFTKQNAENAENRLEIPFERDNPDGAKFVELFSKENFNAQNIKEYIQSQRQEKQDVSAIRGEITAELIKELLKKHFMQTYTEDTFEQAFSTVHIEVTDKATNVFEKHQPSDNAPAIAYKIGERTVDAGTFKKELLQKKSARRIWQYADGKTKTDIWNASNFTHESNLIGNIRSTAKFRHWKANGLARVILIL